MHRTLALCLALTPVFAGATIRETTEISSGVTEGLSVDRGSGDIVALISESNGMATWQLWRQQAMPIADAYTVTSNPFSSPFSVLVNDRFKSESALEIVTPPSKGSVGMQLNGNFIYSANMGATGTDSFVYRLRKNGLVGVAAKVTLQLP